MGERDVWKSVREALRPGDRLLTPGRGIPPSHQAPFLIAEVAPNQLVIKVGKSRFRIALEPGVFEAVIEFLRSPSSTLRVSSVHANVPLTGSVDELIRRISGNPLARGNYVSAILEHARLVKYVMKGRQKHIRLAPPEG